MKKENESLQVPYDYPLCLNNQCPQAATCLRQIVERDVSDSVKYWVVLSPKHQATLTGDCPYYRCNAKVSYAKGFMNILDSLPRKQFEDVTALLISHFSQRTYYRIRKGERLLSPSEQRQVLNILKRCGATGKQEFDGYVEDYEW